MFNLITVICMLPDQAVTFISTARLEMATSVYRQQVSRL